MTPASTFAETLRTFLRDPIVAPLFIILALGMVILFLTIFRAVQAGAFDATKLPRFLFDYVLAEFVPLALLGFLIVIFGWVYDEAHRDIIQTFGLGALAASYGAGVLAVITKDIQKLLDLVRIDPNLSRDIETPKRDEEPIA